MWLVIGTSGSCGLLVGTTVGGHKLVWCLVAQFASSMRDALQHLIHGLLTEAVKAYMACCFYNRCVLLMVFNNSTLIG